MPKRRKWTDNVSFKPSKSHINNIRKSRHLIQNEGGDSGEVEPVVPAFSSSESESNSDQRQNSTSEITDDDDQLEDETTPLPGETPFDKVKVVWEDQNIQVVIQRVAFRRQINHILHVCIIKREKN